MSKVASRHNNFKELRAEFSERFRSNGRYEGYANIPELYAPLLDQYRKARARIAEIGQMQPIPPELRREMENHIRLCGSWKKSILEMSQKAFEFAFIVVAQARLPKEHFMLIVDEARALWRLEGYAEGLPHDQKKIRKALRNRKRH
jgi:hypothetical protein